MMKNRRRWVLRAAKLAAVASLTSMSLSFLSPRANAEEDAATILKQMSDYLGGQKAIKASFNSGIEVVTDDLEKIQFNSSGEVLLERPDKLRMSRTGGYSDVEITYDGKTAVLFGKNVNVFAQFEAPGTTDQLLDRLRNDYEMVMPGTDLLLSDVFSALSKDVVQSKYIGTGVISGIECEHLAFRNYDADWQLWVEAGPQPIPRKLVITNKAVTGAPEYTLLVRSWQTNAPLQPDSFAFNPPNGAKKLEIKEVAALPEIDEVPPGVVHGAKQ